PGIPTELYLPLPPQSYILHSVEPCGPNWVKRFLRLCRELPVRVLSEEGNLPRWLQSRHYSIWQRANLWMLQNAAEHGASRLVVLALWDGGSGDGPGGTGDMLEQARKLAIRVA